jgi:hypothetical protein
VRTEAKELPKIRHRSPEMRQRDHIVTLREEEFLMEGRVGLEVLFPKVEEEVEEEK